MKINRKLAIQTLSAKLAKIRADRLDEDAKRQPEYTTQLRLKIEVREAHIKEDQATLRQMKKALRSGDIDQIREATGNGWRITNTSYEEDRIAKAISILELSTDETVNATANISNLL